MSSVSKAPSTCRVMNWSVSAEKPFPGIWARSSARSTVPLSAGESANVRETWKAPADRHRSKSEARSYWSARPWHASTCTVLIGDDTLTVHELHPQTSSVSVSTLPSSETVVFEHPSIISLTAATPGAMTISQSVHLRMVTTGSGGRDDDCECAHAYEAATRIEHLAVWLLSVRTCLRSSCLSVGFFRSIPSSSCGLAVGSSSDESSFDQSCGTALRSERTATALGPSRSSVQSESSLTTTAESSPPTPSPPSTSSWNERAAISQLTAPSPTLSGSGTRTSSSALVCVHVYLSDVPP
eukprot:scaffold285852_cov28-Tisochrysis_lutea.AAC.1